MVVGCWLLEQAVLRFTVGAGLSRELFFVAEKPKLAGQARSHRVLLAFLMLCGSAVAPAANNQQPTTDSHLSAANNQQAATSNHSLDLLASVATHIHSAPVLRGDFTQERTLAGFSKPLRSSGSFVAARGRGVLWTTTAPFPGELVITEGAIRERVDGKETVVVDASREPALAQVNRILLALLQGDLETLRTQFSAAGSADAQRWQLALTPLGSLAGLIGTIELTGDQQVESVTIRETNGDASRIDFSALSTAQSLANGEAARFD